MKENETLTVENEKKKNVLSKVLVISWEKHSRTRCTDLVWLRCISLLEDTSIEERNSSCRKCNRTSWDVKSISYRTYLILAKKTRNTSLERRHVLWETSYISQKKIRIQRDVRNKSHRVTNDMHFVGNKKKKTFEENGRRDLARNEKRDIYFEKRDISRNVWHFARNLAVDIEKVR